MNKNFISLVFLLLCAVACNSVNEPTAKPLAPTPTAQPTQSLTTSPTEIPTKASPLDGVASWLYYIDNDLEDDSIEQTIASDYDMVVIDYITSVEGDEYYPLAEVIARMHADAHPKLVIAYIDIGEVEDWRTYWQPGWRIGDPDWIIALDPDGWEGDYPVSYWRDEFKALWLGEGGYLQGILDAGFDGVYLDWVEAYSDENVLAFAGDDDVDPVEEMIAWVADIAEFTRGQDPDFILIAQNAAELAQYDEYVEVIDAIAQEHVWFDGGPDNDPPGDCPLPRMNAEVDTQAYRESLSPKCRWYYDDDPYGTLHMSSEEYLVYLEIAQDKGLSIFTIDYALDPTNVAWVYQTSRALGFIPFVTTRQVDQYLEPYP